MARNRISYVHPNAERAATTARLVAQFNAYRLTKGETVNITQRAAKLAASR